MKYQSHTIITKTVIQILRASSCWCEKQTKLRTTSWIVQLYIVFYPKKRLLLITLSENSGRLSWGCSLKYFDKSLLSSYIQKNCEISWWSKLQSQRTLYTQTKLHFFFWSTYALTLDSSTLIGRFNKYCPWCATSISSSVTILKLLFSITCIAMKGR